MGELPSNTVKSVPHGIVEFERLIGMYGAARHPETGIVRTLPFSSRDMHAIELFADKVNASLKTFTTWRGYSDSQATLLYTCTDR